MSVQVRYFFRYLTPYQQEQARARFFNAGPDDGYTYEIGSDGKVLCRTWMRPNRDQPTEETP